MPSYRGTIYLQMSQWDEGLSQGREGQIKPGVAEPLTKKKLARVGCPTGIFRAQLQEVGAAGSAGVSSQGQAAPSPLVRGWPKEGGPEMMLSPHTHTSGDMGTPELRKTSCLFHKTKGMGKSQNGTQPLPSRKREEMGSL